MKRYNSVYDGVYTKPNEMVEEPNGDWVRWEDVAMLEAINAELLEAFKEIMNQTDGRNHSVNGQSRAYAIARAAIAKAKGKQP